MARSAAKDSFRTVSTGFAANDESVSQYYLRLNVDDQPGVLAQIAGVLGRKNIGISSMIQPEEHEEDEAPIVLMLHYATFGTMLAALTEIGELDCVRNEPVLMRVEDL